MVSSERAGIGYETPKIENICASTAMFYKTSKSRLSVNPNIMVYKG
jgi:hypothetical protein